MILTGIVNDKSFLDYAEGDYSYAKNIILNEKYGAVTNEKGTVEKVNINPDATVTVIGTLVVEDALIIFSKQDAGFNEDFNNDFGENQIGIYKNGVYTEVDNTNELALDLNFDDDYPIQSVYQENYKGEIILAWIDGLNVPKLVNIGTLDNPQYTEIDDANDTRLFPNVDAPTILDPTITSDTGSVSRGVYYFIVTYLDNDFTEKRAQHITQPIAITENGSSITIQVNNIDTRYSFIRLNVIKKENNTYSAFRLPLRSITGGSMVLPYSGSETIETVVLESLLLQPLHYTNAKAIETVENQLYIANLQEEEDLDLQSIANAVTINYTTTLAALDNITDETNSRSFQHGEVYAFYLKGHLASGKTTRAFHIPGRVYNSDINFRITDTNDSLTRTMGYWENENEFYPNEGGFPTDGDSQSANRVRHHKFPSIAFCKTNHYNADATYGVSSLDILGIEVGNLAIPTNLQDQLIGFEIFYAKRDFNNSTVFDTDIIEWMSPSPDPAGFIPIFTPPYEFYNQGSGFLVQDVEGGYNSNYSELYGEITTNVPEKYIKLHNITTLKFKPSVLTDIYLQHELSLVKTAASTVALEVDDSIGNSEEQLNVLVDLTESTVATAADLVTPDVMRFEELKFVPANVVVNIGGITVNNQPGNECLIGKVDIGNNTIPNAYANDTEVPLFVTDGNGKILPGAEPSNDIQLQLVTIRRELTDVYNSFLAVTLVGTGKVIRSEEYSLFNAGDSHIGKLSYGGVHTWNKFKHDNKPLKYFTKTITRSIAHSIHNYLAIEDGTEYGSQYYNGDDDASDIMLTWALNDPDSLQDSRDINQWLYDDTFTDVQDLITSTIFNPNIEFVNAFPYRIHRSLSSTEEEFTSSWKKFLTNDYYEQVKTRGEITNIASLGDRLYIHHSNGLFVTRDKTRLQGDLVTVTLGSGDIFDIKPQEIVPEVGYAGTINPIATAKTKLGYVFIDPRQGKVFIVNDGIQEINNTGLKRFFFNYLKQRRTQVTTVTVSVTPSEITNNTVTVPITVDNQDIIPDTINFPYLSHIVDGANYIITTNVQPVTGIDYTFSALKRELITEFNDNPYIGSGYSIAYDEEFNRLLLSKINNATKEFFPQRTVRQYKALQVNSIAPETRIYEAAPTGGAGTTIGETIIMPAGATWFAIDTDAQFVQDKFEIFVNGIMVATSSMDDSIVDNYGGQNYTGALNGQFFDGYDNGYAYNGVTSGYPLSVYNTDNGLPSGNALSNDPYFTGESGGTIPTRLSQFQSDTGLSIPMGPNNQQRVWAAVQEGDIVQVRVSGPNGTAWSWDLVSPSITQYRCPDTSEWLLNPPNCDEVKYWNGSLFVDTDANFLIETIDSTNPSVVGATEYELVSEIVEYYNGEEWQTSQDSKTVKPLLIENRDIIGKVNIDTYDELCNYYDGDVYIDSNNTHKQLVLSGTESDVKLISFNILPCAQLDTGGFPFTVQIQTATSFVIHVGGALSSYTLLLGSSQKSLINNATTDYFVSGALQEVKLFYDETTDITNLNYSNNGVVGLVDFSNFNSLVTANFSNNSISNIALPSDLGFLNEDNPVSLDLSSNSISSTNIKAIIDFIEANAVNQSTNRIVDLSANGNITDNTYINKITDIENTYNITIIVDLIFGDFNGQEFSEDFNI